MHEIAVIGRSLNSENFEILFDMLKDGEEEGKLHYQRYNADIAKLPEADGYVFVATRPKAENKPYAHIMANDDENVIIEKICELGAKLNAGKTNSNPAVDSSSSVGVTVGSGVCNNPSNVSSLRGITLDINGKEVTLDKEEMGLLKGVVDFCFESGYKIKEVICE